MVVPSLIELLGDRAARTNAFNAGVEWALLGEPDDAADAELAGLDSCAV